MKNCFYLFFFSCIFSSSFYSCSNTSTNKDNKSVCHELDSLTSKFLPRYATHFSVSQSTSGVSVLEIKEKGKLVQQVISGHPFCEGLKSQRLFVPEKPDSIVLLSSSFVGFVEALGWTDMVCGVSNASHFKSPWIQTGVESGKITITGEQYVLNIEKLITLKPDLILGFSGEQSYSFDDVSKYNFPIFLVNDWLETHPLGRAEWLVALSSVVGNKDFAIGMLEQISYSYDSIKTMLQTRPKIKVLSGNNYKGTWYFPSGESFQSHLIKDAGGTHPWMENKGSGSIPLGLEVVFKEMMDAEVWINPGAHETMESLLNEDARYHKFKSVEKGEVYSPLLSTKNDSLFYWEHSAVHPDLVLKDLIKIFHPDLMKEHQLVFYKKLK